MSEVPAPEPFGTFLRERRVAKGFTLRKFAIALDVSPTYVTGIENGTQPPPTPERLKRISALIDVDEAELIDRARRWDDAFSIEAKEQPKLVTVYRAVRELTPEQMDEVVQFAQRLPREGGGG